MLHLKNGQAQTVNESKVMTFQFSESKQQVRNVLIESKPWFVAKDVCDVLGLQNSRQSVKELDDDEKLMYKLYTSGQNRNVWVISESGLYALILRSNKPYAKTFRKWITSEVIPALLKKGYYGISSQKAHDYVDARNIPYGTILLNNFNVRSIEIENEVWLSLNDLNRALYASTASNQIAKKLNAIEELAVKIWIFGNTHPAWFVNKKGAQLVLSGSRKNNQLQLNYRR